MSTYGKLLNYNASRTLAADIFSIYGNSIYIEPSDYVSSKTKITVICTIPTCGHTWMARPDHLKAGHGCPKCAYRLKAEKMKEKKASAFNDDIYKVHGDSVKVISEYIHSYSNVTAVCMRDSCNNQWDTTPSKLKAGHGCPICARERQAYSRHYNDLDTETTFYLVYFTQIGLWKFGITTKTVDIRYKDEKQPYTLLYSIVLASGRLAVYVEQYLLKVYRYAQYTGDKVLLSGNTECITVFPKGYQEEITRALELYEI